MTAKITNKLIVRFRDSYGRKNCYPVNGNARAFLAIQGGKTLSNRTLHIVEKMGFDIQVETPNWKDR